MPTDEMIPLNPPTLSKANVRRTAANEGVCELASRLPRTGCDAISMSCRPFSV